MLVIILLALIPLALAEAPYEPAHWKPKGPAFQLPHEEYLPADKHNKKHPADLEFLKEEEVEEKEKEEFEKQEVEEDILTPHRWHEKETHHKHEHPQHFSAWSSSNFVRHPAGSNHHKQTGHLTNNKWHNDW